MSDVIQVLETVSVNTQVHHDGNSFQHEICIIYPDYLDRENKIKKYGCEDEMNEDFVNILTDIEGIFL